MALSRRSSRSRFTLVLLVLTSITVLTLDFRGSAFIDGARSVAATVFSPVRSAAGVVTSPFGNVWDGITDYGDLEAENERLRQQLAEAKGDQARAVEAQRQLEELAHINDLPVTTALSSVTSRVVGAALSNFDHTIEIDKGTSAGVKEGMPVVTGSGLVGRIVQATGSRAVVQLITDPSSVIGIRLATSGELGVARGTGADRPLSVASGIDVQIDIPDDELVTTSGMDRSIYPPDVPVGTVSRVTLSTDQRQKDLAILPLAQLGQLTYVKVLIWEPAP